VFSELAAFGGKEIEALFHGLFTLLYGQNEAVLFQVSQNDIGRSSPQESWRLLDELESRDFLVVRKKKAKDRLFGSKVAPVAPPVGDNQDEDGKNAYDEALRKDGKKKLGKNISQGVHGPSPLQSGAFLSEKEKKVNKESWIAATPLTLQG
jgi:hypothetical protein